MWWRVGVVSEMDVVGVVGVVSEELEVGVVFEEMRGLGGVGKGMREEMREGMREGASEIGVVMVACLTFSFSVELIICFALKTLESLTFLHEEYGYLHEEYG